MTARRHPFVAFEGGDGSGKTTIRKRLYAALRERGRDALSLIPMSWLVPECTEVITNAKYNGVPTPPPRITRAYVRDKEELCARLVEPHLPWRPVLVDRYAASDIVYHQVLYGTPRRTTYEAYAGSRIRWPDLVVYLDTPPEVAVARMEARRPGQLNAWETLEKQRRVYDGFQEVLFGGGFATGAEVMRVDNTGDPEDAVRRVLDELVPRLAPA